MATFNNGESGLSIRTKLNNVMQHADGTPSTLTINDAGADVDVRMESLGQPNAFFLDGGTANIGIGTATATSKLTIIGDANVSGTSTSIAMRDSTMRRIVNPGGASLTSASATATGAIAITLPVGYTNHMMRATIKVFDYVTNESFDIVVAGYNNVAGSTWINCSAYIMGSNAADLNYTVRFGFNATSSKCVIYIGELSTTWAYPQINVVDVQLGYTTTGLDAWDDGWSIGFEAAAFQNVTVTLTNNRIGARLYGAGQTTAALTDAGARSDLFRLSASGNTAGTGGGVIFTSQNADTVNSLGMVAIKSLLVNGAGNTTGDLAFSTRNATTDVSLTERMRITNTGNVGIGNSAPVTTFAVGNAGTTTGALRANSTFVSIDSGFSSADVYGTAALPSLVIGGDLNTGIFHPAADTLAVSTNGTERLRVNTAAVAVTGYLTVTDPVTTRANLGVVIGTNIQAYDAGLQSISGLTTAADQTIYTTASDTYATTGLTAFGRSLIDDVDAAAGRTTLGLVIGTNVQAYDAGLQSIAGLTTLADRTIYTTASDTYAVTTLTAFGRSLIDDVDAAAGRTTLGVVIGTNVQAYDAGLQSISGLTTAADQTIYTTAADTYATTSLTAFGRSLIDDVDAAAGRTTLGLGTIATQASSSVSITGGAISGVTLAGTFALGAAATPSITFTGDTNTGIWSPGVDNVAISTGGVERLRIDASGNVSIGVASTLADFEVRGPALGGTAGDSSLVGVFGSTDANTSTLRVYNYRAATGTSHLTSETRIQRRVDSTDMGYIGFSTNNTIFGTGTSTELMRLTNAGRLGVGTATPAATAIVDLTSTTSGFLPPRMTTTERNAITSPATGLVIYNTTTGREEGYDGAQWIPRIPLDSTEDLIINGGFDVWQRGTSFTAAGYTADRWLHSFVGGTSTISRQSHTLGDLFGTNNPSFFLRMSSSGQTLTSHRTQLLQYVEGVRSYAGQTITVLGWAKRAGGTGNMAVECGQVFGTGGTPSAAVTGLGVTTIGLTGTWAPFAVTLTVPSISGKVLGTAGDDYFFLNFWGSAGADFNGRTNSLGLQTIDIDLWGIHIRVGTWTANDALLYRKRDTATELLKCYRYYYRVTSGAINQAVLVSGGFNQSTTVSRNAINFPVRMRTAPTALEQSGTAGNYAVLNGAVATACTAVPVFQNATEFSALVNTTTGATLVAGQGSLLVSNGVTAAYLGWSAELT